MRIAQRRIDEGAIVGEHYRIHKYLGMGALGKVYACRDIHEGKSELILKVLNSLFTQPVNSMPFNNVISFLQRVRHPNLIRIMDFGLIDGSGELFLVEEFINGRNLNAGREKMNLEATLGLIGMIAGTLQFLHARGIIHGHLRFSNAMVVDSNNGLMKPILVDYGFTSLSQNINQEKNAALLTCAAPES